MADVLISADRAGVVERLKDMGDGSYARVVSAFGSIEGTALSSAARTTTTTSEDLTNATGRGVMLFVNVTAVPTIETLTVRIQVKDPVSLSYSTPISFSTTIATTGLWQYQLYPGIADSGTTRASWALARTWRVSILHSASGSFTYSVGYCLCP